MRSLQRASRRRLEPLLLALAASVIPGSALAAEPAVGAAETNVTPEPARVLLLVRTPGDERVIELLLAELGSHAWRVVELRPDARDVPAPLGQIAAQQSATAVVRFSKTRGAIELWVAGAAGPSEETIVTPGEAPSDPVLALRATEALRARGLHFGPEPRAAEPSRSEPAPPNPRPEPKRPQVPRERASSIRSPRALSLELGPAIAVSPGGVGALVLGGASARAELTTAVGVSASAWLPLASATVRGVEGSAEWTSSLFGGSLDVSLASAGPWVVRAAGGVFVVSTRMTGAPASGFDGRTDSVVAALPFVRTTLRAALGEHFGVWLSGSAGVAFPEVRMSFGERQAARFGRPLLLASLGLDARLLGFEKSAPE